MYCVCVCVCVCARVCARARVVLLVVVVIFFGSNYLKLIHVLIEIRFLRLEAVVRRLGVGNVVLKAEVASLKCCHLLDLRRAR
jgi:hypothetical protein